MKATVFATVLFATAAVSPAAFAACVDDIAKIDEAMKTATLDDAGKAKATETLDKAKAAQAANDEATCAASAKEVLTMLGM
jgi:hypothetical protein